MEPNGHDDSKRARDIPKDDDDDEPLVSQRKTRRAVVPGAECPYLDTIARQVLINTFLNNAFRARTVGS